jgi:hypothetical protein
MDDNVSAIRRTLAVRVLQIEMETIFTSLSAEVERSSFEVLEQRIMIAEFGDMDLRLMTLVDFVDQDAPGLIDDDDVGVLAMDIQDLKMRLGLDLQVYSARPDILQVRQFVVTSLVKARAGADFYGRGLRLFWGDCIYAFRLMRRVFSGYTLSPREVRTLRRTGRDVLTLIPFTVILILPLTPVGHVLVFGFLQRYWPDFFPSTFSEARQTLMKRHEAYAKTIREEASANGASDNGAPLSGDAGGNRLLPGFMDRFPFFKGLPSIGPWKTGGEFDAGQGNGEARSSAGSGTEQRAGQEDSLDKEGRAHVELETLVDDAKSRAQFPRRGRVKVALDDLHLAD